MKNVPLRASVESIGYECDGGVERWSYAVAAGPVRWCRESLPNALRLRAEGRGKSACLLLDLIGDNRPQLDVHEGVIVTEVKRLFEVTGELPPGAALAEPEECFYVR